MALTRKMLKAMGIEEEKIDQIIEAHTDVTDTLKADRDKYKEDADKLPAIQKEVEELREKQNTEDPYKDKYEKEHKDFEAYKADIEAKELKAKKVEAYRGLLKKAGVSEKRLDSIIKVTVMDDIELDDKGEIKDSDKAVEHIKEEYPEFIVTTEEKGAGTENPPKGGEGGKTVSRAAQVVARHNEMIYGVKGENK